VLIGIEQITEGLATVNNPSYFLIKGPFSNNGTRLADTSEASATGSNQTTTETATLAGNQSAITEGGAGSANITSGGDLGTDDPGSESPIIPSATLRSKKT